MGAGASVPDDMPEGPMDKATAQSYFGDRYDDAQFEALADNATGTITSDKVRSLFGQQPEGAAMSMNSNDYFKPSGSQQRSRRRRDAAELMKQWELLSDELEFDRTKPLFQGGQADVYRGESDLLLVSDRK